MSGKIQLALISLSDKSNLNKILKTLKKYNVKIISSGGTSKKIKNLGFKCMEVSKFTKSPEILEGRVKTLHPKIHAGILGKRENKIHQKELKINNYEPIDLVIVNFYQFEKALEKSKKHGKLIESIDIGGPTLVRSAAKNYKDVAVVTNPGQYENLIIEMEKNNGSTSINFRKKLSEQAFTLTAHYDSVISNYFNIQNKNTFPEKKIFYGNLIETLRYGENPHQQAAIYSTKQNLDILQLHGKKLSFNNYNDIFAALNISKTFTKGSGTVIVKHENPCGVSINKNKINSYKEAYSCDPLSAFGGIISCNYKINNKIAIELNKHFFEVVIGLGFNKNALKILKKKKNLRIIDATKLKFENLNNIKTNFNSLLIQSADNKIFQKKNFKVVSKKKPSKKEFNNLIFAFNVCRNVKSNAIVLTKDKATIGIGSGQTSRLDSCKIAINKMKKFQKIKNNEQILAASDAFFPFIDGIETLVQAGVTAVIQPSGSVRDKEIIKFANKVGIVLIFSKTRHFKH
tara:strand:+ start:2314 stop:3858 length:1545 start_codon:yes stop_codon:yes gene_type:complete